MRPITRIRYRRIDNLEVSEDIFIGSSIVRILHIPMVSNFNTLVIHQFFPSPKNLKVVSSPTMKTAKIQVRRWLVKHGASLAPEVRKKK